MQKITREKVFIKKLGRDLYLDFFTIADDNWMSERYGAEKLGDALTNFDADIVLSVFWRALDSESKRLVVNTKIVEWEGMSERPLEFEDPAEKLKHIVSGASELLAIWSAIIETKRKSMPSQVDNEKKKMTEEKS